MGSPGPASSRAAWLLPVLVALAWAAIVLLRLASPGDLLDRDQERPAAYVMDVVRNDRWFCQRDHWDQVSSKPPLFAWLAALPTLAAGRISRATLTFPSWAALLGTAWLLLAAGGLWRGPRTGLLAAAALLLSAPGLKLPVLARTDPLFAFTVALAAALAARAWLRGGGWLPFWLAAAAATLTKGPLGLVLGGAGLLAALWERRGGEPLPLRGRWLPGAWLFLLVTAGWLALAVHSLGPAVLDRMIGRELVGHAVQSDGGKWPGQGFWRPTLYLLGRFAPWSLFALWGVWRACTRPAAGVSERRLERFLACHLLAGLGIFSLAPHQRPDLILVLVPAAALLAGREADRLLAAAEGRWRNRRLARRFAWAGLFLLFLAGAWFYQEAGAGAEKVRRSREARELAGRIARAGGEAFPLTHVDAPYALQFHLQTRRSCLLDFRLAAKMLAGPEPVFLAVRDRERLRAALAEAGAPAPHEVAACPPAGEPWLTVVSNHPRLEPTPSWAARFPPLAVKAEGLLLAADREGFLDLRARGGPWRLRAENASDRGYRLHLRVAGAGRESTLSRTLAPGESWEAAGESGGAPVPRRGRPFSPAGIAAFALALALLVFLGARTVGRILAGVDPG